MTGSFVFASKDMSKGRAKYAAYILKLFAAPNGTNPKYRTEGTAYREPSMLNSRLPNNEIRAYGSRIEDRISVVPIASLVVRFVVLPSSSSPPPTPPPPSPPPLPLRLRLLLPPRTSHRRHRRRGWRSLLKRTRVTLLKYLADLTLEIEMLIEL
jgi:hypothetical protein